MASHFPLQTPLDLPQSPLTPLTPQSPSWHQIHLLNRISSAYEFEVKRLSMELPDEVPNSDKGESSRTTHARRREQVRRAQRKHRERKETYIKSLEQQVLQLLDKQSATQDEKKFIQEENEMLRGLLSQNGISIPSDTPGFGPAATVSMLDLPGGQQRLQVTMPELASDFFNGFDPVSMSSSSPESIGIDALPNVRRAHYRPEQRQVPYAAPGRVGVRPAQSGFANQSGKSLPPLPPPTPDLWGAHPSGLDAAQIAIDFVLALENPCLGHTSGHSAAQTPNGHCLTLQAPLLTHRPADLRSETSWTIPTIEIDRLLNLSSQLSLQGELTPVQAWSRIRSYPGFEKLSYDQLETLKQALLLEVQCYGFGAVMDEEAFENVLRQCFYGL